MTQDEIERWRRIDALLDGALDLQANEREAWLRQACGNDVELYERVKRVLDAGERPDAFLRQPIARVPVDAALPYDRVGPYRLLDVLGRGGMGVVYLAERDDEQFRQRVALKLLRHGVHLDDRIVQRFVEERQMLASLQHPYIARLFDGGLTPDGLPWFAMEHVEGEPIDRYCDAQRATIEARLALFRDVCHAVDHAHRQSIIHRDLKPSNILVDRDGQVRLLDFGIAKLVADEPSTPALTRTGERLLTPEYASPEQVAGGTLSGASDVYSLGVVLFELLAGVRPFTRRGETHHELERAILEEEAPMPSRAAIEATADPESGTSPQQVAAARQLTPDRLTRRLRGDLDAIVLTALRKEPSRRYPSAAALAADVARHLEGRPITARGSDGVYRVRRAMRRHRAVIVGSLAGAAIAAGAFAITRSSEPAATERRVLAIGRIVDRRATPDSTSLDPLVDMLATNLARTPGLQVVSAVRMSELVRELTKRPDAAADAIAAAARLAGATELLEGTVTDARGSALRLDLRRVDLAGGRIASARQVTAHDLFALADSATSGLVADFGLAAPAGSIADVTTRSLDAYRLYTTGLQRFFAQDRAEAQGVFDSALVHDSTFAMAAYYSARSVGYDWRSPTMTREMRAAFEDRVARALRLATRASDRERLIIKTWWARNFFAPELRALAETLAVRYPQEVEGHLDLGLGLLQDGRIVQGVAHLERVVALDSLALGTAAAGCSACEAIRWIADGYALGDSLAAAERAARRWVRLQPNAPLAHWRLAEILDQRGKFVAADSVLARGATLVTRGEDLGPRVKHWLRAGAVERADSLVRARLTSGGGSATVRSYQAIVLRHAGRLPEALGAARQLRIDARERPQAGAAPYSAFAEAQTLLDLGRVRESAALFDSISRWRPAGQPPSVAAMSQMLALSQIATARTMLGDTASLTAIADEIERVGETTSLARGRVQHHYVRGLQLVARGRDAEAIQAFRASLSVSTSDDGRANIELAKALLRLGRATEAIDALRSALRGALLETSNFRFTLTEAHEVLARAWEAAGQADSAAAHLRWVEAARQRLTGR
jgi:serine/threonine protein kinase/tetratricopeptide (TPR) repeat protein